MPIFGRRYDAARAAERRWRRQAHPAELDPRARRARAESGAPRPRTANQSDKVSPSEPEGPPRLPAASPGTRPAPPPLLVDLPHMCWRARVRVFPSAKPPKPPKPAKPPKQTKKPTKR